MSKVTAVFTVTHRCQKHFESARSLLTVGLNTGPGVKKSNFSTASLITNSLPGECSALELTVRPWASFRSNFYFLKIAVV